MGWVDSQLVVMQEGNFQEHSREPGGSPCCMSTQQVGRADAVLLLCCRFCPDFRNVTLERKRGTSSGDNGVFEGRYQHGAAQVSAKAGREIGVGFTASSGPGL